MAETYPEEVSTFKVFGRLARGFIDGPDEGQSPDLIPVVGAKVTFTPGITPPIFRVPVGAGSVTVFQETIVATTNLQGYLVTSENELLEGVVLPFGGDDSITPTGWSWFVTIEVGGNFPARKFSIMGAAGGEVNLGSVVPVPSNPGTSVAEWQFVVDQANTALQETQDARDEVVLVLEDLDLDKMVTVGADGKIPENTIPTRLSVDGLYTTFVPRWAPNTAYAIAAKVLNPTGDIVSAVAAFTSGAAYVPANWALSPTFATPSGVTAAAGVEAWKPSTVYAVGQRVVHPDGNLKVSKTAHTSGTTSPGTVNWSDAPALASEVVARTRDEVRRRSAVRRARGGAISTVPLPAALGWVAPINLFKSGRSYTTDFDVTKFKNVGGTTYYVDTVNGLNANTGLTEAQAWPSLQKAYSVAASGSTIIILDKGVIWRGGGWQNQRIQKSLNVIAKYPGELTIAYADLLAYTLTAGQAAVYESARTNVNAVIDTSIGRHGYQYPKLASVAAVALVPGSWFQAADGTGLLYVHPLDNRAPVPTKLIALLAGEAWYADSTTQAVSLYLEGFTILGGYTGNLMVNSVANTIDVYCKGVVFNWATGAYNAVNIQGGRYAYFQNCIAVNSRKDGFNYTTNNLAVALRDVPHFIEVGCESYAHGLKNDIGGAENTNNATTGHLGTLGVRVGGIYHDTTGGVVADVHTDTKTANYSCQAYDSVAVDLGFNQSFSAQQSGAEVWLFDCEAFGSTSDIYALTGATLHVDSTEYDTKNGGGTFDIVNAL